MRRSSLYFLLLGLLIAAALSSSLWFPEQAVSQAGATPTSAFPLSMYGDEPFSVAGEIGRALPRRIVYDAPTEQFALVDAYNRLLLMDARTYETRFTLRDLPTEDAQQAANIVDMRFSHDGRYLAVINDLDVELWDTQTGTLAASLIAPGDPRQLVGPLAFSSRDEILIFYGVYPAPPALRRSENDTVVYPWVWHLPSALGEGASTLPNGESSQIMYDYRSGFALTPDDHIIASLPSRLVVLDALTLDMLYEIPTTSYETDALRVWTSVSDGKVYVFSGSRSVLLQVDTGSRTVTEYPLEIPLTDDADDVLRGDAQRMSRGVLWRALMGERQRVRTQSLALIDVVQPLDPASGSTRTLLYVRERSGDRRFILSSGEYTVTQMALSPDSTTLLTRESRGGTEVIAAYSIASGREIDALIPSLRSPSPYSRAAQNRVLAFDAAGETFLSDFQRYDAETFTVIAEDLRYSFSYDQFFFGREPGTMVTISGTEWRLWDIATNSVLRREMLTYDAFYIQTISADGYRILYRTDNGMTVQDFDANEVYHLPYAQFAGYGLSIVDSVVNPSWTHLLTVLSDHESGMYGAAGGAIAVTGIGRSIPLWVIAGDDLPPGAGGRAYGWIDDKTVYVGGSGLRDAQPARIYGVDYAPSGLPACLAERFPEHEESLRLLWERRLYFVRSDRLHQLALDLCAASDLGEQEVIATLATTPTFTPMYVENATVTPTPINATAVPVGSVPDCLFDLFPNPAEREAYTRLWRDMAAAVPENAYAELAALVCEGVVLALEGQVSGTGGEGAVSQVMWIDAVSGVRSFGAMPTAPAPRSNPLDLIAPLFAEIMDFPLNMAIMSDDRQLIAASNLPGELTIYRLGFPHEMAGLPYTATAVAASTAQNLIYPESTQAAIVPTQTPFPIGTARPTLTITPSQTIFPLPNEQVVRQNEKICPAQTLYTPQNLPPDYAAEGRIYATFGDSGIWAVEPEDGQRLQDETAPACGFGLNCQYSPDSAWILAQTFELVYVVRPDNSDQRVLWDLRTPNPATPFPQNLRWAAPDMLEWNGVITVGETPTVVPIIARDVLNVFPDPPVIERSPSIRVNGIPATLITRQPGGEWVVVGAQYGTGTGTGNRYYLYHQGTGETIFFAQHPLYSADFSWHPYGERLYFYFPDRTNRPPRYEIVFPTVEAQRARVEESPGGGVWSPDGTHMAVMQNTGLVTYNAETGAEQAYCIPRLASASGSSRLHWSPDSRYVAFVARLIDDQEEHLLVLDTQTGAVVDLVRGIFSLIVWGQNPGSYGTGAVVTPTPTSTPLATATLTGAR